jgi:hypothetical protein
MLSGVIVRHLLIPGMEEDSKKILKYLYDKYGNNIYISIMNQYTPVRKCDYDELNSKVGDDVYNDIIDYMLHNGDNIFSDFEIQVLDKMIKGDLYTEIAHALDKTPKAIDNAIQRIKKKTRDYLLK